MRFSSHLLAFDCTIFCRFSTILCLPRHARGRTRHLSYEADGHASKYRPPYTPTDFGALHENACSTCPTSSRRSCSAKIQDGACHHVIVATSNFYNMQIIRTSNMLICASKDSPEDSVSVLQHRTGFNVLLLEHQYSSSCSDSGSTVSVMCCTHRLTLHRIQALFTQQNLPCQSFPSKLLTDAPLEVWWLCLSASTRSASRTSCANGSGGHVSNVSRRSAKGDRKAYIASTKPTAPQTPSHRQSEWRELECNNEQEPKTTRSSVDSKSQKTTDRASSFAHPRSLDMGALPCARDNRAI